MKYLLLTLLIGCSTINPNVIDGDSFEANGKEFRLACIDAPEWNEPKGEQAKRYLDRWLDHATRIEVVGTGHYGRTIVFLWAGDVLVNGRLYQNGLADYNWDYKCKYKDEIVN